MTTGSPAKLLVELVPSTCWGSNLRSELTKAQWEICKQYVYAKSGRRCEICGGRGDRWAVECHEIWSYDDERFVQTLEGLIALCPDCHLVKHLGRAFAVDQGGRALMHLTEVNGWTFEHAELYVEAVFEVHARRSQGRWDLDTTWLLQIGLPGCITPAGERHAEKD